MNLILTLIKKHKSLASILGVVIALITIIGAVYTGYNNLKTSWYNKGVNDTELMYKAALVDAREQYDIELKEQLKLYKKQLTADFNEELERVRKEKAVDTQVSKDVEYVYKEIVVPTECNTVPVEFSELFNKTINTINSNVTYDKQSRVNTLNTQLFAY